MSVSRLAHITKIGVEQMGDLANSLQDPAVLRLENLDTDLRPPQSALDYTKQVIDDDAANSYLPFFGLDILRQAAADLVGRQAGQRYDWKTECVISAGGLSGILNVLLAVSPLGLDSATAAQRLLAIGKIAATPMVNWGSATSSRYVRFVFANEPVERLQGIATRVRRALT